MIANNPVSPPLVGETPSNKWLVLAAVSMAIFLAAIDASIVNIALPTLEQDLNTTFAWVQWVVLAYLLTITGLVMTFGRLGDMLGKKKLYLAGFVVFTTGSALCGMAPNIHFLIGFRALQGIGGSILQALGIAIITEAFPSHERGKALGIGGTMVSVGIALGPSLGGILISLFGWRSIFLVNVPIGIVGVFVAHRYIPVSQSKGRQRFDILGAFLLTITLLAFSLGMTLSQENGFDDALVLLLLIGCVVGLGVFLMVENRSPHPIIRLEMFRNRNFTLSLAAGVSVFVVVATNFIVPFYLEFGRGYEVQQIGLMIGAFPIMLGVLSPLAGSLSDRFGTRPISLLGLCISIVACLGLSTLNDHTSVLGFVLRLTLLGGGIGVFQSPNNSAIMGSVPKDQLGVASSLLATSRNVGQSIGLPILGTVFATRTFDLAGKTSEISQTPAYAVIGGIQTVYLSAAILLMMTAAIFAWNLQQIKR